MYAKRLTATFIVSLLTMTLGCVQKISTSQSAQSKMAYAESMKGTKAAISKDYVKAIEHDKKALEMMPDNADFKYSLGRNLESVGKPSEAKKVYEEIIALPEKNSSGMSNEQYKKAAVDRLKNIKTPN